MATITVAIPLHGSAEWVDNIVDNVERLPPQVTEIIISDRTCVDDAAELLRRRLEDDHRVTIISEASGLTWEQHFQTLLEQAQGELFMWMPHDDIFEANWIPILEETLGKYPDAWLAFGRVDPVERDGHTPRRRWEPTPFPVGPIPPDQILDFALRGQLGVPVRGLFRRTEVLDAGIRLEPVGHSPCSDDFWVLAVALRSGLAYDDRCVTRKRYYSTSTHAQWERRPGQLQRSILRVVSRHGPGGVAQLEMQVKVLRSLGRKWAGRLARMLGWKRR